MNPEGGGGTCPCPNVETPLVSRGRVGHSSIGGLAASVKRVRDILEALCSGLGESPYLGYWRLHVRQSVCYSASVDSWLVAYHFIARRRLEC